MKRLSIIVPTYNMEAYLARCIDSVLAAAQAEAIELLVVNDGSRDASLQIASDYARRHPDIVHVIDKPNGNYGSTINAALPVAQGEYIKILDADDRYDSAALDSLLDALERLSGVDMVVTPYIEEGEGTARRVDYNIYSRKAYDYEQPYDFERIVTDGAIRFFAMHSVTYRTAVLRQSGYRQSEGISYTDQEWVFYPLFRVQNIAFTEAPVYRYNVAREGQTMDAAVQLRHIAHLERVAEAMADYFATHASDELSTPRRNFLREIVAGRLRVVYRKYLLDMSDETFATCGFDKTMRHLESLARACDIDNLYVPVNNLLRIDLLRHWLRHARRYPASVRALLRLCDRAMVLTHAALFRRR